MIKLEDVDISFGDRTILDQATWTLVDNDRVGLVGENGSGKTTLLRAMAGLQEVDRGRVIIPRGVDIGYLPQSGAALEGRSLDEEVREAARPILHLLEECQRLEERMPTMDDPAARESMLLRMTELMDQFQFRDGYQVESRIARVLKGLGFKDEDRDRPLHAFPADGRCGSRWPSS